jgi:hypothetical protein
MEHKDGKPHHHGDLRRALVAAGLDLLVEGGLPALTLRACAARAADDAARLVAIARGYLFFAEENPALFHLMFTTSPRTEQAGGELDEAASGSYQVLAAGCAPFQRDGEAPSVTEMTVWSLVHGLAHLNMNHRGSPDREEPYDIADLLRPFLDGLKSA